MGEVDGAISSRSIVLMAARSRLALVDQRLEASTPRRRLRERLAARARSTGVPMSGPYSRRST